MPSRPSPGLSGAVSSGEFRSIKILSQKGIVPRWHSVATQCVWLQHIGLRHTCVAQRQMSRRAAVVAQRSAGDGLFRGAKVGKGSTQSRCRCGRGVDSAAVASDERSPKCTCRLLGASRTKLRCAHTAHVHETCAPSGGKANSAPRSTIVSAAGVSTQQTRHFRPPSQVLGRTPRRIAACRSCQWRSSGSRSRWC